jgi:hypothetical protein
VLLLAVAAFPSAYALSRHGAPGRESRSSVPTPLDPAHAPLAKVPAPQPLAPAAPPPNAYIGSAACGGCHEKQLAAWKKSWHARALAPAGPQSVVGNFNNAHFAGSSSEAWMKRKGAGYVMRTLGVDGALADFAVNWVIGGKRMQDTLNVFPDGRWQILPVYFHVSDKAWVDYTETKQGALTPAHPFYWTNWRRMANHECLDCHTTGLHVAYDADKRQWTTSFADGNVACEDCHGPGARHADSLEPADIVQPKKAAQVGLAACARCHGPRRPLFPMLDPEHQFRLGIDRYDEIYDPIVVTMPDGMSPEFFADGRPKTSSFEYQAMIQSACYRKGGVTCLSCHTAPHQPHRAAELRGKAADDVCSSCHQDVVAEGQAHTHHKAATAQRCVACHMPPVVSGVLDHFADHAIDVPSPANSARHGVPSACGVCHADLPARQLADSLAGWWPGAGKRQARRLRLADAFDEATAKDSARALVDVIGDSQEAPTLRGAAAIVLARRFGPSFVEKLLPLLDSPDLILRAKACEALGAFKDHGAADAVAAHLGDPVLRVRQACALALFDTGDARGEPAMRAFTASSTTDHLLMPHYELGMKEAGRGDWAAARTELTWAVKLAPYYVDALVNLAAVAAEQGDFSTARARVEQALRLDPANRDALELLGKLDHLPNAP